MTLADQILDALTQRGTVKGPDRSGQFQTLCPFHDETRPSFSFNPEKGVYHCFACPAQGTSRMLAEYLGIKAGPLTVEQLAEAKGLPAGWLTEHKLIRQGTKGVEIPYVNEKGEEAAVRTRLNICKLKKDDRFLWRKNDKVLPYGLFGLKAQKLKGYTVLVEGESDSWHLWHAGFPCIGIPGARTWQSHWAKYLVDFPKVFIWVEPDAAGHSFVADVAEDVPNLYVLVAPGNIKDPAELRQSDRAAFENTLLSLMDDAPTAKDWLAQYEVDHPEYYHGKLGPWHWDSEGLYRQGPKGESYMLLPLSIHPVQILLTPEGRQHVHLMIKAGNRVPDCYLSDEWVGKRGSDASRELAEYGIPLTAKQVTHLQEFVGHLLLAGILPQAHAFKHLGWYDDRLFMPGLNNATFMPPPGMEWLKYYGLANTDEETEARTAWQYLMEIAMKQSPSLVVGIGAALAAPLLEMFPRTEYISFAVHFHTPGTGTGKTTILEAGCACMGDARRICTSWDATKVGLEQMLGAVRHAPLFLNELGDAKFGVPEDAILMLGEEVGRRRGTSGGGLRATSEWRTSLLSTGNAPIAPGSAHHARRVLSVPAALPSEDFAAECQEISHRFYGHPLRWCLPFYARTDLVERARELTVCYEHLFTDSLLPIKPQAKLWAFVELGARMLLAALGMPEDGAHTAILRAAHLSAIRRQAEGVDYVTRLLDLVTEDMARDPGGYGVRPFGTQPTRPLRGIAGRVVETNEDGHPEVVAVLPGRTLEMAQRSSIPDLTGVLVECRDRGVLLTGRDKGRMTKKVRVGETPAWCHVFQLPTLDGDDDDDGGGNRGGNRIEAVFPPCSHLPVFVPTVPT